MAEGNRIGLTPTAQEPQLRQAKVQVARTNITPTNFVRPGGNFNAGFN